MDKSNKNLEQIKMQKLETLLKDSDKWYFNDVYIYLLKYEDRFNDLIGFILNCNKAVSGIRFEIDTNTPLIEAAKQKSYYERITEPNKESYKLNDFEFYLTRFIVAFYLGNFVNNDYYSDYFKMVLSITESQKGKFDLYINYFENGRGIEDLLEGNICNAWQMQPFEPNTATNQTKQQSIRPIQLEMEQRQIIYLFQKLIDEKLLNETKNPTVWDLVAKYFTDKDNRPLKNIHQNKEGLNNTKTGKPQKNATEIENIIMETKNQK